MKALLMIPAYGGLSTGSPQRSRARKGKDDDDNAG
jgi:hypothetical protein